jgi:hypothetical protein
MGQVPILTLLIGVTMKKALISSLTVGSVFLGASVALGATVTITRSIDSFTQPFPTPLEVISNTVPNATSAETGLTGSSTTILPVPSTGTIGGTRQTTLEIRSPIDPLSVGDTTQLQIGIGTGVLIQGFIGALVGNLTTTTLTWDGGGGVSGLATNLSEFNRFVLPVNIFALLDSINTTGIGTVTLRARNSLGGPVAESNQTLNGISSSTPLTFNYSGFSNSSVFSAPLYDIQLEIEGLQNGLEFTLGGLSVFGERTIPNIPEPSLTLTCLTLGGLSLTVGRWKRQRSDRKD